MNYMKNFIKKFKYELIMFVAFISQIINCCWYESTESPNKANSIFNFMVLGFICSTLLSTLFNTLHTKK